MMTAIDNMTVTARVPVPVFGLVPFFGKLIFCNIILYIFQTFRHCASVPTQCNRVLDLGKELAFAKLLFALHFWDTDLLSW